MGNIELGALIAVLGCFVGLYGWLAGRDKKVAGDAQWRGSVDAKLDLIVGIKSDVAKLDAVVGSHSERLAKVESSAAQSHHRIDELCDKIK